VSIESFTDRFPVLPLQIGCLGHGAESTANLLRTIQGEELTIFVGLVETNAPFHDIKSPSGHCDDGCIAPSGTVVSDLLVHAKER
jgi:hypothetical protein